MKAKVTTSVANIRFQPGGSIAARIDKGTVVDVLSEEDSWAIINYYDTERYIEKKDLNYVNKKEIKRVRVIVPTLNVRKTPRGQIVGKVHLNDEMNVLNEENGWCRITYNDKPAYVSADYLEFKAESPEITARGVITISGLNVRKKPQGEKMGVVTDDQFLDILSEKNGWYEIAFKGKSGYVYGKYVNKFTARVKPNLLNVRDKPKGNVIGKVEKDTLLNFLVDENGWMHVIFQGQKGYVMTKYMEKLTNAPQQNIKSDKSYLIEKENLNRIALEPVKKLEQGGNEDERTLKNIWNQYGNLMHELSEHLNIETASAVAIFAIESRGVGFWKENHSIIRFEAHVFHKFWGKDHEETFRRHFKFNPTKRWTGQAYRENPDDNWTELHTGDDYQRREWEALNIARKLDEEKALESQSIGAPQILGANYSRLGYASVQNMFEHFNRDIRYHIFGFFDFLDDEMMAMIRKKRFKKFAGKYNGPGNAEHYGNHIKQYYELYKNLV